MGVSFDLFGTLVTADYPENPAAAVGRQLERHDISVPSDWDDAYCEPHREVPAGAECPLPVHVHAALESRGIETAVSTVRAAVVAAFDPSVTTRAGAQDAVAAAGDCGPVGICSNCSVPGLVETTLERSALEPSAFDAIVTSVDCGWRKPAAEIFEQLAAALQTTPAQLVHVGDDPRTDGGLESLGGRSIFLEETPLAAVPERLATLSGDGPVTDRSEFGTER